MMERQPNKPLTQQDQRRKTDDDERRFLALRQIQHDQQTRRIAAQRAAGQI